MSAHGFVSRVFSSSRFIFCCQNKEQKHIPTKIEIEIETKTNGFMQRTMLHEYENFVVTNIRRDCVNRGRIKELNRQQQKKIGSLS